MENKNSSILLKALAPEFLLMLGVIQALFPYMIWAISGPNENYNQEIFGTPILLWVIGFLSFCVGARSASISQSRMNLDLMIHTRRMKFILYLSLLIWFALFFLVVNAYGGIPIVQFLSGYNSIENVNSSQAAAIPGLFGIWLILNTFLTINIALLIISRHSCKRILSGLVLISLVAVIFGSIMDGKRQGLLIVASIILPSIIIGMSYFLTNSRFRSFKRRVFLLSIAALISIILLFGFIGYIRTGGRIEGGSIMQIFNYLQFPLINMEWQLQEFGLVDGAGNIFPLLAGLIPYRLISGSEYGLYNTYAIFSFFYPEPGIGAGYFGPAHLAFGIVGVIVFGFLTGLISRKIFNLARFDPRWSVPYSCFVWPLISAHSYSHLTSALFFLIPFFFSIIISHFVFFSRPLKNPPYLPQMCYHMHNGSLQI